jgi:hypothetical protein
VTTRGRAHRVVGILGVLAFLASGLDMHFRHDHLRGLDMATRLSFRSIHIYLLFSALLNLGFAFVKEPLESGMHRVFTSFGVYASALGTVLLTIASASRVRR